MLTDKDVAEVYRIGLVIGLFEVKEVVAWADALISSQSDPDYSLIEVSMASDATEGKMATLLQAVPGEHDPKTARQVVYGLLGRRLAADPSSTDAIGAQVKAIAKSENAFDEVGEDLLPSLQRFDAQAGEWVKQRGH